MDALRGKRIVVTRPRQQAGELVDLLAQEGAEPILFPTIEIHPPSDHSPLDTAVQKLDRYNWLIFTSVNGVACFWDRLEAAGKDIDALAHMSVAAIGPATTLSLASRGVTPHLIPGEFVAEALLEEIPDVRGKRILIPRAQESRAVLVEGLRRRGAEVDEIPVYKTLTAKPDPQALSRIQAGVDAVTFTSSSTVRGFMELVGPLLLENIRQENCLVACIGPVTAHTAAEHGLDVRVVASEYTGRGLVRALIQYYQSNS